jgi:hypothetical protein
MNDVSLPMLYSDTDGFELVATPTSATFRAKYMSFKKGHYFLGAEQEEVPLGTTFVVHGAMQGWAYMARGEKMRRIPREKGKPFPSREELGDTDPAKWPQFDGKPSDPWSLSNELLMTMRDTGQPVIFSIRSWSGREVVEDLCRLVMFQRKQRGDNAKPVVAIGSATRKNPRGMYDIPTFTIIEWISADAVPEPEPSQLANDLSEQLQGSSTISPTAKSTAPLPQPRRRKASEPAPRVADDLDDEVAW